MLHTNGFSINMIRALRGVGVTVIWRRGAGLKRGLLQNYGSFYKEFPGISQDSMLIMQTEKIRGSDIQQRLRAGEKSAVNAAASNHHFTPESE